METIGKITWMIAEVSATVIATAVIAAVSVALSPVIILNRILTDIK